MDQTLEWIGAILGLCGAILLALNNRNSRYGWIIFFIANIFMIWFAIDIKAWGLLTQQLGFLVTSSLGIYKSWCIL